jgi:hypothetical protein
VALLVYFINRKASLELALAAVVAGGVLIVPHNTITDGLLFLPLILEARRFDSAPARALAVVALIPIVPPGTLQIVMILLLILTLRMLHTEPPLAVPQPAATAPA